MARIVPMIVQEVINRLRKNNEKTVRDKDQTLDLPNPPVWNIIKNKVNTDEFGNCKGPDRPRRTCTVDDSIIIQKKKLQLPLPQI